MQGCLLDTNHVSAYFDELPSVVNKINALPAEAGVWVTTISLGEIEAGHHMTLTTDPSRRFEFQQWVRETFSYHRLEVSTYTGQYYGKILGRIFAKYPPATDKIKTERWLVDLKVDTNDIWIVATAWEHNLLLLTDDNMEKIREAVYGDVRFENWIRPE